MKNVWQLAVIDTSMVNASRFPTLAKSISNTISQCNGEVAFIVGSTVISLHELVECQPLAAKINGRELADELLHADMYRNFGVPYATVFYPKTKHYGIVMLDVLRPILSEEDALEVEMKFGIDLSQYTEKDSASNG